MKLFPLKLCIVFSILSFTNIKAQIPIGTLISEEIQAIAVSSNNRIFSNARHPVLVYLPPSYYTNLDKQYPVVYYLGGYSEKIVLEYRDHTSWSGGYHIYNSNNDMVTKGTSKEIIMIIAQGLSEIKGAFYTNSEATSNWEDFVVQDLVNYMDTTYRTIPEASSRALAGLSMGGYGALNLAMNHPDVFSVAYGISSGLFDENGLRDHIFNDTNKIHDFIDLQENLALMNREAAHNSFMGMIQGLSSSERFPYAYGLAFAPDTISNAPYISYPYSRVDNHLLVDSTILKKWESGFGNLNEKIIQYKDSLLKLKAYWFDYGINDSYTAIPNGNSYYSSLLTKNGIPHKAFQHDGTHANHTGESIEEYLMPLCDSLLVFDTPNLNREADLIYLNCSGLLSIDTISSQNNRLKLRVVLKDYMDIGNLSFRYSISSGAKIHPSPAIYKDYTNGEIRYTITSESKLDTTVCDIQVVKESALSNKQSTLYSDNKYLTIYPNPCTGKSIHMKFNTPREYNGTVTIYNLALQVLKTFRQTINDEITIDVSDIQDNIVFLQFKNESILICQKIVLIK